jgi:hypothetical protein
VPGFPPPGDGSWFGRAGDVPGSGGVGFGLVGGYLTASDGPCYNQRNSAPGLFLSPGGEPVTRRGWDLRGGGGCYAGSLGFGLGLLGAAPMALTHPAVPWLVRWLRAERFLLAARAARIAVHEFPLYQRIPEAEVGAVFALAYAVLADALESGDLAPVQAYVAEVGAARIAAGSRPQDVQALAEVLLAQVRQELGAVAATTASAAAAQRLWPRIERVVWTALGPLLAGPTAEA